MRQSGLAAHQNVKRRLGRAIGAGDIDAKLLGTLTGLDRQSTGTGHCGLRELHRHILWKTLVDTRRCQSLDHQKYIGRTGTRHARNRIHLLFILQHKRLTHGGHQALRFCHIFLRCAPIADQRCDSLANGRRRVGHGAHDGRGFPQDILKGRNGRARGHGDKQGCG